MAATRRAQWLPRVALALLAVGVISFVAFGERAGSAVGGPRLMDGTKPKPLPPQLARQIPHAVLTRIRIAHASEISPVRLATCVRRTTSVPRRLLVVERVGVNGSSLTFARRGAVYGCDAIPNMKPDRGRPAGTPWCGGGVGRITPLGLSDPRLSVTCQDRDGKVTAFAWVRPAEGAWWIVVRDGALREVYPLNAAKPRTSMTPDADPLVGRWRAEHDRAARWGIGAHVTVRTPFLHPEEWADTRISDVLQPFLPLTINLARLENRPGALVILVESDNELRVITAATDAAWPTLPAHRGRPDFAYHVTVVRTPDPHVRAAAAAEIAPQLPMQATGSEVWAAHVDRDQHMSHPVIARGHISEPHGQRPGDP